MKNKFVKEILIFIFSLLGLFVFFQSSTTQTNPDTEVAIPIYNVSALENKKTNLMNDLNAISSVKSVDVSSDTEVIVLEVDNETFDIESVRKTLEKWEVDYEEEFDVNVIADALEY